MVKFLLASALSCLAAVSADAQLLSPDQIIKNIEGRWSVPHKNADTGASVNDCDTLALRIWLQEEDGSLIFYSQFESEAEEVVTRAPVQMQQTEDAGFHPWIHLQYDGEKRLTESGDPVSWRLVMIGRDRFVWQRSDWEWPISTEVRNRCAEPDLVS